MSNIKRIFIEMENLTDTQQLDLWQNLWNFADQKLDENNLMVFVISKEKKSK